MNREDYFAKMRFFVATCFEPPPEDKPNVWGKHYSVGIVCRSAVEAMECVRKQHPTYRINSVNEHGIVHHVMESVVNGS